MMKTLLAAAAVAGLGVSTGLAEPTVVRAEGPVPDGHPFLIQNGAQATTYPVPPRPLQFALIDGRRALVDPDTLAVVTWLLP